MILGLKGNSGCELHILGDKGEENISDTKDKSKKSKRDNVIYLCTKIPKISYFYTLS